MCQLYRLGIWLGLCAMSYLNAYGFLLCSIFVFTLSCLTDTRKQIDWKYWLKRGILVAVIGLLVCGWWFVRNYMIYDGDWLGLATSNDFADRYAQEQFSPSTALSPEGHRATQSCPCSPGTGCSTSSAVL